MQPSLGAPVADLANHVPTAVAPQRDEVPPIPRAGNEVLPIHCARKGSLLASAESCLLTDLMHGPRIYSPAASSRCQRTDRSQGASKLSRKRDHMPPPLQAWAVWTKYLSILRGMLAFVPAPACALHPSKSSTLPAWKQNHVLCAVGYLPTDPAKSYHCLISTGPPASIPSTMRWFRRLHPCVVPR
eukprot:5722116-Amphidinium_carterae.1